MVVTGIITHVIVRPKSVHLIQLNQIVKPLGATGVTGYVKRNPAAWSALIIQPKLVAKTLDATGIITVVIVRPKSVHFIQLNQIVKPLGATGGMEAAMTLQQHAVN